MKSKTKKLFLSMFAFASLAITACGTKGNNSTAGNSSSSGSSETQNSSVVEENSSDGGNDSEQETQIAKLIVSIDGEEAELDEELGQYSSGEVDLEENQVLKAFGKDADGNKVSIFSKISLPYEASDWFEVDENEETLTVLVSGTYEFNFVYEDGEFALSIEKKAEEVEYQATLTEGVLGDNLLVHVFNNDGGVENVIPNTYGENILTFTTIATDLTNFIVVRLKPGAEDLGEKWSNVEKQSEVLTLSTTNVNFTWKANADDNYHLWGTTDGKNWGELGKFTLVDSVYTATVNLPKGAEFVFHLETFSDEDTGWRKFTDLVGSGVEGNFKANEIEGTNKNNIIVETAGEYTFTVTADHKIQVGNESPEPSTTFASTYKAAYGTIGSSEATWGWDGAITGATVADPLYSDQAKYTITVTEGQAFKLRPEEDLGTWYGFDELDQSYTFASEGAEKNVILKAGTYDIYLKQLKSDSSIKIGLYKHGTNVTIAFDSGTIGSFVGSNHLYAWAWGSDYGSGILVPANGSTNIVLKDNATGFKLLTTSEAVAEEDYDDYPTSPVKEGNDISVIKEGTLVYNSGTNKFNYDGDVIENITLTFTNNKNFTNLKCYVYGSSGETAAWPGETVTYKGKNDYNEDQYTILIAGDTDFVVFNGSEGQTVNVVISELGTDRTIYCLDGKDSSGHYLVGHSA